MLDKVKEFINAEGMGGPALIMLIATVAGGGCNFLFQISMQNLIPGQIAELNTLLAILYIIAVPAGTVQNVLTRYVSKYKAWGKERAISWLLRRTLVVVTVAGLAISIVLAIALNIPEVREVLKLTSTEATLIIAAGVLISLVAPIGSGPLQGLQRFVPFGVTSVGNFILKLVLGVAFTAVGFGVAGAVGGVIIGLAFSAFFSIFIVRRYLLGPGEPTETGEIWRYTLPVTLGVLCFTVLTNVDVIFATILFDKETANYYTVASMLSKIILFLPGAVSSVMFPKISKAHAERTSTLRILRQAITLTLLLAGLVAAVYVIAPSLVLNILVPGKYDVAVTAPLLQYLAVAMTLLGLANLFMLYGLATDGHAYIVIMVLSILVLGGLVGGIIASGVLFTPVLLAMVMVATGLFIIAFSGGYLMIMEKESRVVFRR